MESIQYHLCSFQSKMRVCLHPAIDAAVSPRLRPLVTLLVNCSKDNNQYTSLGAGGGLRMTHDHGLDLPWANSEANIKIVWASTDLIGPIVTGVSHWWANRRSG